LEHAAYRRGLIRSASLAAGVVAIVGALAVLALHQSKRAKAEASKAIQAAAAEKQQRTTTQYTLYAADMRLVERAVQERNLGRASELLEQHRPRPGEEDLRHWEWRYLWARCRTDALYTFCQHSNAVTAVAFAHDGKLLAVADIDGVVRLWDVSTRREVAKLQERGLWRSMSSSAEGKLLAVGGVDAQGKGVARLWDVPRGRQLAEFPHEGDVRSIAFAHSGSDLATYDLTGNASLWNLASGRLITNISLTTGDIYFEGVVLYSPDKASLVFGDGAGNIRIFDRAGTREVKSIKAHTNGISAMALCLDGAILASAGAYTETTIKLWDFGTGRELGRLTGHTAWVSSLLFSKDGSTLVSAGADQTIRFWDITTRMEIAAYRGHLAEVWALAFSPDYQTLFSGGKDGTVLAWNAQPPQRCEALITFPARSSPVFSPDSEKVAVLAPDGAIALRRSATMQETGRLVSLGTNNSTVTFSRAGRFLAVGDELGRVKVWDFVKEIPVATLSNQPSVIRFLSFLSEDGRLLAIDNDTVQLWDTVTWRELASWPVADSFQSVVLSPDERRLAFAHNNRLTTIWGLATGEKQMTLRGHKDRVRGVAFSPDGKFLLTGSEDATVKLWDLATQQARELTQSQFMAVHSVAFSADGKRLITGSGGREAIKIWDVVTLQETACLQASGQLFRGIRFSPDGNWVAGISQGQIAYVWRAPTWTQINAAEMAKASNLREP